MKKLTIAFCLLILAFGSINGQNSTMTIREVFDFQPGDIFHFRKNYPSIPGGYFGAIRFEVTLKTISPGNDTLCYTLLHSDYEGQHISVGYTNYSFYNFTKQVCYTNLDSLVHTLIDTTCMLTGPILNFTQKTYVDTTLCDSMVYTYKAYYNCQYSSFEPLIISASYGKGLGITAYTYDYYYSFPPEYESWQMVYFKKGPVPCGTPDYTTAGIENSMPFGFQCYPNPATSAITLEFSENLMHSNKDLTLCNTLGQIVLREKCGEGKGFCSLDINHLPSGTYFLQISGDGFSTVIRKVMKN